MNNPSDSASAPIDDPVTDIAPVLTDEPQAAAPPPPTPSSRRNWREDRNRRNGDNLLNALDFTK